MLVPRIGLHIYVCIITVSARLDTFARVVYVWSALVTLVFLCLLLYTMNNVVPCASDARMRDFALEALKMKDPFEGP